MRSTVILAGVLMIVGGLTPFIMFLKRRARLREQTERYEFEHRTSGGTVEFESYEAAKHHEWLKHSAESGGFLGVVGGLGFIAAVLGLLLLFTVWIWT